MRHGTFVCGCVPLPVNTCLLVCAIAFAHFHWFVGARSLFWHVCWFSGWVHAFSAHAAARRRELACSWAEVVGESGRVNARAASARRRKPQLTAALVTLGAHALGRAAAPAAGGARCRRRCLCVSGPLLRAAAGSARLCVQRAHLGGVEPLLIKREAVDLPLI